MPLVFPSIIRRRTAGATNRPGVAALPFGSLASGPALRLTVTLVVAAIIGIRGDLPVVTFLVAVAALGLGAWRIARTGLRLHVADDVLLAAVSVAAAWLAVLAEALSWQRWLGWQVGWLGGCLALFLLSRAISPPVRRLDWRLPLAPIRALGFWGRLLFLVFLLPLASMAVLVWFSGITNADSLTTYLPRAVSFLRHGAFDASSGPLDYLQYFHTTLVAFPMLFLRTDAHINPLSMVSGLLASIGLAALARSFGWRGWLPLVAACVPWLAPKTVLTAPTSGFDILAGLWLVCTVYFLRRGYAATSLRWLALAALTMALALATKPTFYFAAPGLAVLWTLTLVRGYRRGRGRRTVIVVATAGAIMLLVGTPFLIRNVTLRGYLVAPLDDAARLAGEDGYSFTPAIRARAATVSFTGLVLQLATPPYWLPDSLDAQVEPLMRAVIVYLGHDATMGPYTRQLRHGDEPYHADHAGFGAVVPLVIVPALLLVPFVARRRLGPRRIYLWWIVGLTGAYVLTMSAAIAISPSYNRYLLEWLFLVATVAPVLVIASPARYRGVVVIVLSLPLLAEQYDAFRHSRQLPPRMVTTTPREDQVYAWFGWPSLATQQAVRAFNRRYSGAPVLYVAERSFRADYLFTGPSLTRETSAWTPPPVGSGPIRLPGFTLTQSESLAERMAAEPFVVVERLSADTWLLHPLSRPLILYAVTASRTGGLTLLVHAYAPPDRYRQPEYRATVVYDAAAGRQLVRDYAADPTFTIPLARFADHVIIEVRDAADPSIPVDFLKVEHARVDGDDVVVSRP